MSGRAGCCVKNWQIDPGHRRAHVMVQMPVVIQPHEVEQPERPQVQRPLLHVALRPVMVGVLHRRPEEPETEHHGEIIEERDLPEPDHRGVQQDRRQRFELDEPRVFRIQRLQERLRGAIELRVARRDDRGLEQDDEVGEEDEHPEQPGQRAVELDVFPEPVLVLEIQVERFVVRPVADVVADVTLADEVERGGKEERQEGSHRLIHLGVRMQQVVLGFVQHRVARIHREERCERLGNEGRPRVDRRIFQDGSRGDGVQGGALPASAIPAIVPQFFGSGAGQAMGGNEPPGSVA